MAPVGVSLLVMLREGQLNAGREERKEEEWDYRNRYSDLLYQRMAHIYYYFPATNCSPILFPVDVRTNSTSLIGSPESSHEKCQWNLSSSLIEVQFATSNADKYFAAVVVSFSLSSLLPGTGSLLFPEHLSHVPTRRSYLSRLVLSCHILHGIRPF